LQRPHYFALQAAAIRDKKVYVLKPPSFRAKPVQIYLDVEGDQERSFVYLLGMLVVDTFFADYNAFDAGIVGAAFVGFGAIVSVKSSSA
jgi:predicted RecB family nuclease